MDWNNLVYNGLSSATASIISRILTHPLDTAKARMQANLQADQSSNSSTSNTRYKGTFDVLRRTIQKEGILALYGGFGAIVIGGTPGTMLYLCSYDVCKDYLSKLGSSADNHRSSMPDFSVHFISGMVAETVACFVYVPVDVIKERLQVQQNLSFKQPFLYKGSYDALKQILKSEGLGGIYKGYGATLASFGPFSALYFVFYEKAKSFAHTYHAFPSTVLHPSSSSSQARIADSLPFPYIVLCSSSAGAAAAWLTSPLDMAKLRLQIQRGSNNSSNLGYRNMLHCLTDTYKLEGLVGLWRGAGARVLHFAPATCITMTCYEQCRAYFANQTFFKF